MDGYTIDPSEDYGHVLQPLLVSVDAALAAPALVLLGEAGIGKSDVMDTAAAAIRQTAGDAALLYLDLGTFAEVSDLDDELFQSSKWTTWKQGEGRLHLVLDSLDEALMDAGNIVGLLQRRLVDLPFDRLQVVISCRTAAWPETLTGLFQAVFGPTEEDVRVYEVAGLLRKNIAMAAQARGIDADRFLAAVQELGAQPLASNPASLNLLLTLYQRDAGLPRSRVDLYEQGLTSLAEPPRQRVDRQTAEPFLPAQLIEVATRIAGMSLLTGKPAVYTGGMAGTPGGAVRLGELVGGSEGADAARIDVTADAVRAALRTGLFNGRGADLFGPAHRTYGEFLAARYLMRSGLSSRQRDGLLYLSDERPRRLVPQLHETAAWLASMEPDFLRQVVAEEAEVLLLSDVAAQDSLVRVAIVDGLLGRVDAGLLSYDQRHALEKSFGALNHPRLAEQLRPVITNPQRSEATRDTAIEIARACNLNDLAHDLAGLVLDTTAPFQLRVVAGYGVLDLGAPEARARLKPLAFGDAESDPMEQLRGVALQACWPEHMTADELFRALTPPRVRNFLGSYSGFLMRNRIAEELSSADLPRGLVWAREFHARDPDAGELVSIGGQLATRAWRDVQEPGVLPALADFLLQRYRDHAVPFHVTPEGERRSRHRNDRAAVNALIRDEAATRQTVLEAVIGLVGVANDEYVLSHAETPLVIGDDFAWLLELALTRPEPFSRTAARLARTIFDVSRLDHVEAWLASQSAQPIADIFRFPLQVEIDSPEARQSRAEYRKWHRPERRKRRALDRPPSDFVREAVAECLSGQPDRFWQLTRALTIQPDGAWQQLGPEDLRKTPGWNEADCTLRGQILDAAVAFLTQPPADPAVYLHRDDGIPASDWAAPSAVLLLHNERPTALEALPAQALAGWVPNLLAELAGGFNCESEDKAEICNLLARRAPDSCRGAVLTLVQRGRQAAYSPGILYLWEPLLDSGLAAELLHLVSAPGYALPVLVGVLDVTLQRHPAITGQAVRQFVPTPPPPDGPDRERSIAVAALAVRRAAGYYWPLVWENMQRDADWGRLVARRIASRFDDTAPSFTSELTDEWAGDLVKWLFDNLPPENDPDLRSGFVSAGLDDNAENLRRTLINHLEGRGTQSACASLARLRDAFPQNLWLGDVLLRAQAARRRTGWTPPTPANLRRLVENRQRRFVASPTALLDAIIESLERLEEKLHGELPARVDLWDQIAPDRRRPVDEEHLSDYIARHLTTDLVESGIVVNREVQIRRRAVPRAAGGVPGEEVDLIVDAVSPQNGGVETFRIPVEVKGCWHQEVRTAMETQLTQRYLRGNRSRHGLFLVGWFAATAWDADDARKSQVPWRTIDDARAELNEQARTLSGTADADEVRAHVLDCTLR